MGAYACEPPGLDSVQAAQILGVAPSAIETYIKASKGRQVSAAILARLAYNVLGRVVRFAQAAGYELSNRGEQVTDVYTIDFQALHEPHVPLGFDAVDYVVADVVQVDDPVPCGD